jgi:hypothetical protein
LMSWENCDWTECVPARSRCRRSCRRERDLTHERTFAFGDERDHQGVLGTKLLDEFGLVSIGVGHAQERRLDDLADSFEVAGALWSDFHSRNHAAA